MQKKSLCADDSVLQTIEKYSSMVYRLAFALVKSKCDADDIHQEVFIRYIFKEPHFESDEHAKAWFIRVTTNLCKSWWKTAWKRRVVSLTEYEDEYGEYGKAFGMTGQGTNRESDMVDSEIIDIVKTLPQKYRVVIHLFYYEEMSVEEIAQTLDMKASTVRTQLTRARKRLGELLKEEI